MRAHADDIRFWRRTVDQPADSKSIEKQLASAVRGIRIFGGTGLRAGIGPVGMAAHPVQVQKERRCRNKPDNKQDDKPDRHCCSKPSSFPFLKPLLATVPDRDMFERPRASAYADLAHHYCEGPMPLDDNRPSIPVMRTMVYATLLGAAAWNLLAVAIEKIL